MKFFSLSQLIAENNILDFEKVTFLLGIIGKAVSLTELNQQLHCLILYSNG